MMIDVYMREIRRKEDLRACMRVKCSKLRNRKGDTNDTNDI